MKPAKIIHVTLTIILVSSLTLLGAKCKSNQPLERKYEPKTGGSCNKIESEGEGYCSDYIGCQAYSASPCSDKNYSTDPCPTSTIGGCKLNAGTEKEKIIWSYDWGGRPIKPDQIKDELKPSCSYRGGQWVNAN